MTSAEALSPSTEAPSTLRHTIAAAELHLGDCLAVMRALPACSVDAIVTDPPYGLSFMGKKWDYDVPSVEVWAECLRVLKPGGHLLAFAGTRTQHRMAVRIEDAGFEIRDMIAWVYGSGFPKSLDVSKAIDGNAGQDRPDAIKGGHMGISIRGGDPRSQRADFLQKAVPSEVNKGAAMRGTPVTDAAGQWQGWGTALKPALEPITVARKPLAGTVAENVLKHGTGGLNIDGCRVAAEGEANPSEARRATARKTGNAPGRPGEYGESLKNRTSPERYMEVRAGEALGRWPANLIHDGSDEVLAGFPQAPGQKAAISGAAPSEKTSNVYDRMRREGEASSDSDNEGAVGFKMKPGMRRLDTGSAARFFYVPKADNADREDGLDGFPKTLASVGNMDAAGRDPTNPNNYAKDSCKARIDKGLPPTDPRSNTHPTVKPTDLMRYLCRLVTPPGGLILDPFMGSGSTGKAALMEGFRFTGIERDPEYFAIAAVTQGTLL